MLPWKHWIMQLQPGEIETTATHKKYCTDVYVHFQRIRIWFCMCVCDVIIDMKNVVAKIHFVLSGQHGNNRRKKKLQTHFQSMVLFGSPLLNIYIFRVNKTINFSTQWPHHGWLFQKFFNVHSQFACGQLGEMNACQIPVQ